MRWPAAFSSSPVAPRLGFSRPSSSATIRAVVQSLMEPSHNDTLNHVPAHLPCNFGVPNQPRQQLRCATNLAGKLGAPSQSRQQLGRARSTSPATSGQPRQQLRCSPATSPETSTATSVQPPQQPRRSQATSPATSSLLVNFANNSGAHRQPRQQLGLRGNLACNFGASSQPRQQPRCPWSTSPATSVRLVNHASNCQGSRATSPAQPRQQLRRSRSTPPATSTLSVNLASNFDALGQRSRATSPATPVLSATWPATSPANSSLPAISPATLTLPATSPAPSAVPATSPATSALPVNLARNFGARSTLPAPRLSQSRGNVILPLGPQSRGMTMLFVTFPIFFPAIPLGRRARLAAAFRADSPLRRPCVPHVFAPWVQMAPPPSRSRHSFGQRVRQARRALRGFAPSTSVSSDSQDSEVGVPWVSCSEDHSSRRVRARQSLKHVFIFSSPFPAPWHWPCFCPAVLLPPPLRHAVKRS